MERYFWGVLFFTCFMFVSPIRAKGLSNNDQRVNEWDWNRNSQLTDGQSKSSSQANWPTKGSGSAKGRGDMNPDRDSPWGQDWSAGENTKNGYDMTWNMEPQGNNKGSAYPESSPDEGEGNLETLLRGVPGMDFPNFVTIPETEFDCSSVPTRGYYGDVEAGCQVFHICQPGNKKDSFLCPVGTIFNQKYFVCDWWFNVNCTDTPSYYDLNNDVYSDTSPATEELPVTTEMMLPWNSQDLDKKRPTKSWGNPSSMGKKNTRWNDVSNGRASKPGSNGIHREVSKTWSQSDVQQKDITVSWGSSSGTTGAFGSSSTFSNSIVPTTKPMWYGSDGKPAKDQSSIMSRRNGLTQTPTPPPFGTRMRSRTRMGRTNIWPSTKSYQPTQPTLNINNYGSTRNWAKGDEGLELSTTVVDGANSGSFSTSRGWLKNDAPGDNDYNNGHFTRQWSKNDVAGDNFNNGNNIRPNRGWMKDDIVVDKSNNNGNYDSTTKGWPRNEVSADFQNDNGNYGFSTTERWLKIEDIPETSINPSGIKGVWEQQSTRRSDQGGKSGTNSVGHKGFVTKSDSSRMHNSWKSQATTNEKKELRRRQSFRNTQTSTGSNRNWFKQKFEKRNLYDNSNGKNILRRKAWN